MPMLDDDSIHSYPLPPEMSEYERRLALGRTSAARQATTKATPDVKPASQGGGALYDAMMAIHKRIDPGTYFGGPAGTAGFVASLVAPGIRPMPRVATPTPAPAAPAVPPLERPVNYQGLDFTPEQWAAAVRARMPQNLAVGREGFTNVPEGAMPMSAAPEMVPMSMAPRSLTPELRGIHQRVKTQNQLANYKSPETYTNADKTRVRNAALNNRRDNRAIEELVRKGELDEGTKRIARGRY